MTVRDARRSAVYEAERAVESVLGRDRVGPVTVSLHGSSLTLPVERRFGDAAGVQRYVDAVLDLDWVTARWPGQRVAVRARRGQRMAHYEPAPEPVIAVPVETTWALRELVVLHEVAHHLARVSVGGAEPSHGPTWAGVYLNLAAVCVGPEVALLLRASFADAGVPADESLSYVTEGAV
ncbi:MAG: TIGR04338 family metallohydrolase [Candidatus Nanopelagicales bacterium]